MASNNSVASQQVANQQLNALAIMAQQLMSPPSTPQAYPAPSAPTQGAPMGGGAPSMAGLGMLAYAPPRQSYGDAPYLIPNSTPGDIQNSMSVPTYQSGGALPVVNSPYYARSGIGSNPFGT